MDAETLQARVAAFPVWHYELDLGGVRTPIADERWVNRHAQRRAYFFEPLVRACGGSLAGRRVLDLASNAGFWSLAAIEAGCDYVLGVDGRQMHVDQASLVFEAKGVDPGRYDFRLGDVFALDPAEIGTFDVVLCLGLMYHVDHPVGLMRLVDACSSDLAVLDTQLTELGGSVFELRREDVDSPRNALREESILVPSRQAVVDLAERFGFAVRVLEPAFTSYRGARDYQAGLRRAFLCAKRTPIGP